MTYKISGRQTITRAPGNVAWRAQATLKKQSLPGRNAACALPAGRVRDKPGRSQRPGSSYVADLPEFTAPQKRMPAWDHMRAAPSRCRARISAPSGLSPARVLTGLIMLTTVRDAIATRLPPVHGLANDAGPPLRNTPMSVIRPYDNGTAAVGTMQFDTQVLCRRESNFSSVLSPVSHENTPARLHVRHRRQLAALTLTASPTMPATPTPHEPGRESQRLALLRDIYRERIQRSDVARMTWARERLGDLWPVYTTQERLLLHSLSCKTDNAAERAAFRERSPTPVQFLNKVLAIQLATMSYPNADIVYPSLNAEEVSIHSAALLYGMRPWTLDNAGRLLFDTWYCDGPSGRLLAGALASRSLGLRLLACVDRPLTSGGVWFDGLVPGGAGNKTAMSLALGFADAQGWDQQRINALFADQDECRGLQRPSIAQLPHIVIQRLQDLNEDTMFPIGSPCQSIGTTLKRFGPGYGIPVDDVRDADQRLARFRQLEQAWHAAPPQARPPFSPRTMAAAHLFRANNMLMLRDEEPVEKQVQRRVYNAFYAQIFDFAEDPVNGNWLWFRNEVRLPDDTRAHLPLVELACAIDAETLATAPALIKDIRAYYDDLMSRERWIIRAGDDTASGWRSYFDSRLADSPLAALAEDVVALSTDASLQATATPDGNDTSPAYDASEPVRQADMTAMIDTLDHLQTWTLAARILPVDSVRHEMMQATLSGWRRGMAFGDADLFAAYGLEQDNINGMMAVLRMSSEANLPLLLPLPDRRPPGARTVLCDNPAAQPPADAQRPARSAQPVRISPTVVADAQWLSDRPTVAAVRDFLQAAPRMAALSQGGALPAARPVNHYITFPIDNGLHGDDTDEVRARRMMHWGLQGIADFSPTLRMLMQRNPLLFPDRAPLTLHFTSRETRAVDHHARKITLPYPDAEDHRCFVSPDGFTAFRIEHDWITAFVDALSGPWNDTGADPLAHRGALIYFTDRILFEAGRLDVPERMVSELVPAWLPHTQRRQTIDHSRDVIFRAMVAENAFIDALIGKYVPFPERVRDLPVGREVRSNPRETLLQSDRLRSAMQEEASSGEHDASLYQACAERFDALFDWTGSARMMSAVARPFADKLTKIAGEMYLNDAQFRFLADRWWHANAGVQWHFQALASMPEALAFRIERDKHVLSVCMQPLYYQSAEGPRLMEEVRRYTGALWALVGEKFSRNDARFKRPLERGLHVCLEDQYLHRNLTMRLPRRVSAQLEKAEAPLRLYTVKARRIADVEDAILLKRGLSG